MTSSVIGLIDLSAVESPHVSGGSFIASDRVTPPPSALKPIESAQRLWDILDTQCTRARARAAAEAEARRAEPERQAAALALRQHQQVVDETRSHVAKIRALLENLRPPAGTREELLVSALAATIDAFTASPVHSAEVDP
ncbi:hypothetical protein QTI24_01445 [Variovorax sp. J22P240]|uniref:hypothetical protein n=1 Tax=Variovorax sp. J22P240 TaxID=3053514 RepID=UPI0025758E8A|nr:hypothetical protein [Variovorax sp. J22P240]MDL9997246.1 hypothetical protein [Variovorax sp. J22P240]